MRDCRCLLIEPFPESALNEEAGKLLLENYEEYAKHARLMTSIHAQPPKRSAELAVYMQISCISTCLCVALGGQDLLLVQHPPSVQVKLDRPTTDTVAIGRFAMLDVGYMYVQVPCPQCC